MPFSLAAPAHHELIIKKSRFIACVEPVTGREQALVRVAQLKAEHPDARHVCWALLAGGQSAANDDGEPGGTAGQPILRALQGQGVDHVTVAVVRYYGGIKLGTGGLARAYGNLAAECVRTARRHLVRPRVTVTASVPFADVSTLYHLLTQHDTERGEETYTATGLTLTLNLYPEDTGTFRDALRDATRGNGELSEA